MKKTRIVIFMILLLFLICSGVYSETTIDTSNAPDIAAAGISEIGTLIQESVDYFGPGIANGFALSNFAGYPMGKAYLGGFPHFFIGASLTAGLTNMEYFDSEKKEERKYPAGGVNPAAYFGLGLGKGLDIMFKTLVFSSGMYNPPYSKTYLQLNKLNLYSVGGKIRYNLIQDHTILPGLLELGGVTFSIGADMLKGLLQVGGQLEYPLGNIQVDIPSPVSTTEDVSLDLTSDYTADIKWYILSANSQIIAYFDFLWIFSMYTGLGISFNFGHFSLDVEGTGTVTTTSSTYIAAAGTDTLGTMTLASSNSYSPKIYVPLYIIGFDISLFLIHITAESMVNLRNKKDINLQLGAKIQI